MMKKLLATLLALAMLALPVLSLADGDAMSMSIRLSNLNVPLTGDADTDAYLNGILNDLLDALEFVIAGRENEDGTTQVAFTLNLSGAAALTMNAQYEKDGYLFSSNLLGSDMVAISFDELTAFMENNKASMLEGGMTEEQYQQMMSQLSTAFANSSFMTGGMDLENMMEMDDLDLTATSSAMQALVNSAVITEGELTEQPEGCDEAVSVVTATVSGEQMTVVYHAMIHDVMNTTFMTTMMESLNENPVFVMDGENVDVKEAFLSALDSFSIQDDVVYTYFLDKNGELVRMEGTATMVQDNNTDDSLGFNFIINRVTEGTTASYTFDATLTNAQDESLQILGSIKPVDDGIKLNVTIASDGTTVDVAFDVNEQETASKTVTDILFTMSVKETADAEAEGFRIRVQATELEGEKEDTTIAVDVLPLDNDTPYITLTITATEGAQLEKLDGSNAVHPLSMSEEELNAWAEGVTVSAQTALVSAIQLLPESVLNMVMSMLQQ